MSKNPEDNKENYGGKSVSGGRDPNVPPKEIKMTAATAAGAGGPDEGETWDRPAITEVINEEVESEGVVEELEGMRFDHEIP